MTKSISVAVELLDQLAGMELDTTERSIKIQDELRAILAQPAEAEGVEAVAWLHRQGNHTEAADRPLTEDEEARGWEQDESLTVTQHLAALSAVTAERDRLLEANEILESQERYREQDRLAATEEADQLRAEVEGMRAQRDKMAQILRDLVPGCKWRFMRPRIDQALQEVDGGN